MDDSRFRRPMVEHPAPADSSQGSIGDPPVSVLEKPFALRSTIYTIGFLLIVLGVVPSIFFLGDRLLTTGNESRYIIQEFWSGFRAIVGMAVFAAGLATYTACSIWLIYHGRGPHVEFDPPKAFVATGPYRWVRNPVVITLIVTAIGEAIYFASIGIAIFVALGMAFAQYQVTKLEEPLLKKRFGEPYEDYCRKVNRWCPKPPSD